MKALHALLNMNIEYFQSGLWKNIGPWFLYKGENLNEKVDIRIICRYILCVIIWDVGHQIKKNGFSSNDSECMSLNFYGSGIKRYKDIFKISVLLNQEHLS